MMEFSQTQTHKQAQGEPQSPALWLPLAPVPTVEASEATDLMGFERTSGEFEIFRVRTIWHPRKQTAIGFDRCLLVEEREPLLYSMMSALGPRVVAR